MSPEHAQIRCGHATASEFGAVIAKGEGKMRKAYLRRVVAEMLTGKPVTTFRGPHMDRGQEQEPFGCMAYVAATGNMVDTGDDGFLFIKHPTLAIGCSPDGLIDEDGGLELKSVIPTVQIDTILAGKYPSEHRPQVQGNLWLTQRKWWDFCSYCADMPQPHLRRYIFRVERDEEYIAMLDREVTAFIREAEQLRDVLLERDTLVDGLRASLKAVA